MQLDQIEFNHKSEPLIDNYFSLIDDRLLTLEKNLNLLPISIEETGNKNWSTRTIFNALSNIFVRITTIEETLSLPPTPCPSSEELIQLAKRIKAEQSKTDLFILISPILFRLTQLERQADKGR